MKVSRDRVAANRAGVIAAASRLYRQRGVDGVGIDAVMAAAGLTAGGFYKNFSSKEDLVCEAFGSALASTVDDLRRTAAAPSPLRAFVDSYLCTDHRDGTAEGCALAGLAADAARRGGKAMEVFGSGVGEFLEAVEAVLPDTPGPRRRKKAALVTSIMVGALTLARAVGDSELSQRFLDTAKAQVLALGEAP